MAEGIDSDLNNLVTLMNATKMFPDSLFLDEIVRVARKELSWEVDYIRSFKYDLAVLIYIMSYESVASAQRKTAL